MQSSSPILENYISLREAAREPGMPSVRTLQAMAKEGRLPVTSIGRRLYLDVPAFRALLQANTVKVTA